MLAAFLFTLIQDPVPNLVLTRGVNEVWNVQDTTLSSIDPDVNFGGAATLIGGSGKTILIRFGDLGRLVPIGKRVAAARLVLTQQGGQVADLQSIGSVRDRWDEGPRRTFYQSFAANDPKQKPKPPYGAATWRERRGQAVAWDRPGAAGPKDAYPVEGAATQIAENELVISGLGKAVNEMARNPEANHGFALRFNTNSEFASCESISKRPRLEVTLEDAPVTPKGNDLALTGLTIENNVARATVFNNSDQAIAAFTVSFRTDEGDLVAKSVGPLAPRTSAVVEQPLALSKATLVRERPVTARVEADGDQNPQNDAITGYVGAPTIQTSVEAARWFNETYLGESRFSFAPSGTNLRVNVNSGEEGADGEEAMMAIYRQIFRDSLAQFNPPNGRKFSDNAGLSGWGDTRFDGVVPTQIPLPIGAQSSPVFDTNPLIPSRLLNMTEVAYLNRDETKDWPGLPKTTILRVQDSLGRPLPGAVAVINAGGEKPVELTVPASGSLLMPKIDNKMSNFGVVFGLNGGTDTPPIFLWQLVDAASRGNREVAFLEIRTNLSSARIDRETDLAVNKLVIDSAGTPPAQWIGLTQDASAGGNGPTAKLPADKGSWIEIDLGRDRTIAEVELVFDPATMWKQFDIVGYGTGQKPGEAGLFAQEMNASVRTSPAFYRGPAPRVRYLRIINRSGETGRIRSIRVRPAIL
jgi:hypothetical protein